MLFGKRSGKSKTSEPVPVEELDPFDLDTPLISFSDVDDWTIRNAVTGTVIFGAIGSGKSSGSGWALARAMLEAGFGFLVLTAKPDERALWESYAAATGRSDDVIVFSPENKWRFNFLNYEMNRTGVGGGLTENVVNLFLEVMEISDRKRGGGGGGDSFWKDTLKQLLRSTVDLLSIAQGTVSLEEIHRVIQSAPQTLDDVRSKAWRDTSFCAQLIFKGGEKRKDLDPMRAGDFELTGRYFLNDFAALNQKTKSIIQTSFSAMADTFLRGTLRDLFCTTTNIVPEVTYQSGSILIIDLPIKQYNELGTFAQVLFKYIFQHTVERRDVKKHPRPVALWCDEAQLFVASYDRSFQSTARSARVATVYLSQNLSGYYASLGGGEQGRMEADSLLGNLATKIFHANGDAATNNFAADLCGKSLQYRTGFSSTQTADGHGGSQSLNQSQQLDHDVLPSDFMKLRTGGSDYDLCVDGIVCKSGGTWKCNGESWLKTTFKQG